MANAIAENVIRVDTTAQFDGKHNISFIKVVGGTCTIQAIDSSGQIIYSGAGGDADEVRIRTAGMYVTVAGGAVVFIYKNVE